MKSPCWISIVCCCFVAGNTSTFARGGHGGGGGGGHSAGAASAATGGHAHPGAVSTSNGGLTGNVNGGQPFGSNIVGGTPSPFGGGIPHQSSGGPATFNNSPAFGPATSAVHTNGFGGSRQFGVEHGNVNGGSHQAGMNSNLTTGFGTSHHPGQGQSGNISNSGGNLGFAPQFGGQLHFGRNTENSFHHDDRTNNIGLSRSQAANAGHAHSHGNGTWKYGHVTSSHSGSGTIVRQVNNQAGGQPFFWGSSGLGSGSWGQGSLIYGSGYLGYMNPYYSNNDLSGFYNYTQPILVSNTPSQTMTSKAPNLGQRLLNAAVAAFLQEDYESALEIANRGIEEFPSDAVFHEFRALVLFAKRDYQQSAATIHAVLAVGPGWDWTTLISLYRNADVYTSQLRALETHVKQNPDDGAIRFLLAYHYLTDGYPEAAARILRRVVTLVPNDRVAVDLLKMVSKPQESTSTDAVPQPTPEAPSTETSSITTQILPTSLVGTWNATRTDGSTFTLKLTDEMKFSWSFAHQQQPTQSFDGAYSLQGSLLSLESQVRGSFVAQLKSIDGARFNLKVVGAPEEDPGLDFGQTNGR